MLFGFHILALIQAWLLSACQSIHGDIQKQELAITNTFSQMFANFSHFGTYTHHTHIYVQ